MPGPTQPFRPGGGQSAGVGPTTPFGGTSSGESSPPSGSGGGGGGVSEPVDDGVFPALANIIDSFDSVRFGDKIHAVTHERTTGRVSYHVFNMATEVWETVNQQVLASNSDGDIGVTICVRSNGEPVIVFMGDREAGGPVDWGGLIVAYAGDYKRAYITRRVSGVWTTPEMVGSPNDLAATFFPVGLDYNGAVDIKTGRLMAEADDWVRLVFSIDEPADVASNPDLYTQSLRPDNVLTEAHEFKLATGLKYSAGCLVGQPAVFQYDGTWYTAVPVGLLFFPAIYIWEGIGTLGDATYVVPIVDETTGVQVQPDTFCTQNPPMSVHWFKNKLYVVMGTRSGSTTEWTVLKTISPPFSEAQPDPLARPRDDQAGVTWPNGTYARQGVEFASIGGRDLLFKVSTGNAGSTKILEKLDLATDIPGDNSYTVTQFLIDNA